MPYYSFMILCYNKWDVTKQAIKTLIDSFEYTYINKGIEILIVDNGSKCIPQQWINNSKSRYIKDNINIIYIQIEENMGYPIGVNIGLAHCKGEIIAILNNDLIFPKDWFNGLANTIEENESIGIAAPYLSYAYGVQNIGIRLDSIEEINICGKKIMNENKDKIIFTTRAVGACIVLKKQVLEKVGGNDFWYGIGHFDDDDLCLRIRIAGYKIAIVGNSFVYHIGSTSFKELKEDINNFVYINKMKFYNKWKLKNDRVINSNYIDREAIINDNNFNKKRHYIPISYNDYRLEKQFHLSVNSKKEKLLLVADWNNKYSSWERKIKSILNTKKSNEELNLWIPSRYFNFLELKNKIDNCIVNHQNKKDSIIYINENINPIDLMSFINQFNSLIKVENDFVNKYILYLGNILDKPCIDV
ncbi:MAG: glycosyltransferase [Vallitalea sp.]|jgi:GT2 family glycosyltransferase|nr:glycosyltransferase [Vallitalea sp.]